jgi:hypothetical protein
LPGYLVLPLPAVPYTDRAAEKAPSKPGFTTTGCHCTLEFDRTAIDRALKSFWLERARTAPQARSLEQHIAEQEKYLAAIRPDIEEGTGKQ